MNARMFILDLCLLSILTVPGCATNTSTQNLSAAIMIGNGNELVYQTWLSPERVYSGGAKVLLEWRHGITSINGNVYKPHPASPPTTYPVDSLQKLYGNVPYINDYVSTHPGDAETVWNQACLTWSSMKQSLAKEAQDLYAANIKDLTPPEAAMHSMNLLLKSRLVRDVRLDSTVESSSRQQVLWISWEGTEDEYWVELNRPGITGDSIS